MSSSRPFANPRRQRRTAAPRRSGMTLVEILISTAVTLIMIFAIVRIFEWVGSSVAQGRAAIEMSGQIRGAAHRLREDIRGITVPMRPWPRSSAAEGYFEILEGPLRDAWIPASDTRANDTRFGDPDDVFMFTARSVDEPFVGRFNGVSIESQVAEIIWWTRLDPRHDQNGNGLLDPGDYLTLHRRVLLVRPDLTINWAINGPTALADLRNFYMDNDVSVRFVPNNAGVASGLAANSLADLTKRENRFAHVTSNTFPFGTFPFPIDVNSGNPTCLANLAQSGLHEGDDVVLSHVQAFDIRVFDPGASIRTDGIGRALVPSDPGWVAAVNNGNAEIGRGAFVDLNYLGAAGTSVFSGPVNPLSQLNLSLPAGAAVYDTWSFHYEHDGIDQDQSLGSWHVGADQGTNGLDDDGSNGPDDTFERETSPPYPVPLRGMQIKIRIDDPDSRQVREASVVSDFIPE